MKHTVSELKLNNGARGLLVHVPDATVMTFQIDFRAGEFLVGRKKWETPHLMEHMLLGANKRIRKARDFQAEFEKNGAYTNASTGVYEVTYEAECADFEWQRILDWMIVAITEPLFLKDEFKSEYGNVREEMSARSNSHFRHLSLALREAFGFHAMSDKERLKMMRNVRLTDIRNHYKATHLASNMRFIIAGNIPASRRQHIKEALENIALLKGRGRKKLPKEQPKRLNEPLILRNRTIKNYYFYFDTFMKRPMEDDELDSMQLINSMLTETLYSRILGAAREKGLVYGMSSGVDMRKYSSNWWFGAQVRPDNAHKLFDVIVREILRVLDGKISDKDLEAAKQYSLGRYQRGAQTVGGIASAYAGRYFFDDTVVDYELIPQRIKAVTKTKMIECARDMFSEKIGGLGVLGNPKKEEIEALDAKLQILWEK